MNRLAPLDDPALLRLLPLGGLGEIGMNLMVLESAGELLLIDCGLKFPEAHQLGVDLVLPDISALQERVADIQAILLTHGHEDHIGALPFLLDQLGNPPIFGTPLTLGLLKGKFEEHKCLDRADLRPVDLRHPYTIGRFEVEFFRAAHSIVDGAGMAIRTPAGLVVHTGDFKLDQTPVDGQRTDLSRLASYGEEGVLLLLSDSTNVERTGHTLSERTVGEAFNDLIPRAPGRVVVATFSSNIHRLQQAIDTAAACGRKVLVNGRSMVSNLAIARQLGYLRVPDDLLINLGEMRDLPPEQVLILTTGSQGEPLSALTRIALDDHKKIHLVPGDTVILSSKFIPGNEKAIAELINHLYRRGAEVYYEKTSEIHVSGHASQEELKTVLGLVRPQHFVPIHGEYRHLVKHAELARQMGLAEERVAVIDNGTPLLISDNGLAREERVDSGRVLVDGKGIGDVGQMELRDRRHLGYHGLVTVVLGIDQAQGELVYGPEIFTRGFTDESNAAHFAEETAKLVGQTLQEHSIEAISDLDELRVEVRKVIRRHCNRTLARRPLILPVVLEL